MTSFSSLKRSPMALALACLLSGPALAASYVFTLDADFDKGTLNGVNHAAPNANQLQLNVTGSSFPVLWIANAGEDTLSKIDSTQVSPIKPGTEVGRYRTWFNAGGYDHGAWGGPAPSRTAVDRDGNAYVLNRWFGGYPTLFKILSNSYIDRNGNGAMDTSTGGAATMMPLVDTNGNGLIDANEIQDERIAWVKRVPDGANGRPLRNDGIGRALCIGPDNHLWVGLYNSHEYWKVSSVDGSTLAGPVSTGSLVNYGCLIDGNGTLWGASWGNSKLIRIANTHTDGTGATPYTVSTFDVPQVYGLALRRDNLGRTHVIMGGSCESYVELIDGVPGYTTPAQGTHYCSYAVGTDNDGNITVSKTGGGVVKYSPTGVPLWDKGSQVGGSDSRGVIADSNNNIWQVHRETHNIAKYNGVNGDFMGVLPVGFEPYTYSDASGTALLSVTTHTGTWSVVQDASYAGTSWKSVGWSANVPSGASVVTEVRAADTKAELPSKSFKAVSSGLPFAGVSGRYLEARVTLTSNSNNQSPIVYDVTLNTLGGCDIDGDGDVDLDDLALIRAGIGQTPTVNDPRDANGDGLITINDVRYCTLRCTRASCAR